ncbi:DNA-directed RNA polymerase I subunit rpa49 [Recurvomyces mirabilis]|uniref:DNA-directed RNA polymerase I subunit rpa49 n=1 Tax=Recurvomyces mirabilis TaxID=574656 RepID=A0AAE1C033_9PEZI|nr:DNA-directed RNA polymerase I subunit rpa49 [Recurvomyces mirabilis]KAK5151005.1 DNA-directed RNA polymerase I subunit rpa49 [Recurvomyces mirabilis]
MAGTDGKKRKRARDEREDVAAKSQKIGGDVNVTYLEPEGLHPVLLSAPGLITPSLPFHAYSKPKSTKSTKSAGNLPKPTTHHLTLHSSHHQRVDYTATPSTTDQHLTHYLGIFDPTTSTLQLVPSHHLTLHAIPRKNDPTPSDRAAKQRKTYTSQREALGREFGTKKAQKILDSRTVNAIIAPTPKGKGKTSDVQDAILDSIAENTTPAGNREEMEQDLLSSKPIPRPNLQAETVEDVYPFSTLIPASDLRLIPTEDWLDAVHSGEAILFSHRFPAKRVEGIAKSEDMEKLKALRYMTLLLEFHDVLQTAGRGGKKVPKKEVMGQKLGGWPGQLVESVRRLFANERGELGKWELERLWCWVCALGLFVSEGWRMEMSDLKLDLKMENKQLAQYFVELGAKVSAPSEKDREAFGMSKAQASVSRVARLRLPLEFPKVRSGRRR